MVKTTSRHYFGRVSTPTPDPSDATATLALYRDRIMDHARKPRNFGKLEAPTHRAVGHNPLCGDQLTLALRCDGELVAQILFEGQGCALSIASACSR